MIVPTAAAILDQLDQKDAPVLNLLALCRTPDYQGVWTQGPQLFRRFAGMLLKHGNPTLALEVAARGLHQLYPNDHDLLFCRARALVNCGNTTRAALFVQDLLARTDLAPARRIEVLSLAGRIRKDLAARTIDLSLRTARLREAFSFYQQAYELGGDTFPGINAASLALLVGDAERARSLAARVRRDILSQLEESATSPDYWRLATLGEASLLLGYADAAVEHYGQAVALARAGHNNGDIASMLRQLRLLREHLPVADDLLDLFHLGPVVVFAGHGIDWPGQPLRFPSDPSLEAAVRRAILKELDTLETSIGYCSPGCGSNLLFGEVMRERDAELHVVLPFSEKDFVVECLTHGIPAMEPWRQRYENLCSYGRVSRHFATTEEYLDDQVLYDFSGSFMQGLALTRAAQFCVDAVAVVVQDPAPSGPTGLATFVENWKRTKRKLRVIDLAELRSGLHLAATPAATPPPQPPMRRRPRTVQTMLFADVAGFSGLPESHLPAFFVEFLALVEQELKVTPTLFQNTWGDGLHIIFADVVECADFALRLLTRLESFDFASYGFHLPEDKKPGVRIGLHCGPVFLAWDAVMARDNYFGRHVSRAARIEPVTAPGCAFVSEQFAAALALAPDHDFVCEYLGVQPLAKDYDICPLYRLTTAREYV